jgi:hypothetical protein
VPAAAPDVIQTSGAPRAPQAGSSRSWNAVGAAAEAYRSGPSAGDAAKFFSDVTGALPSNAHEAAIEQYRNGNVGPWEELDKAAGVIDTLPAE